MSEGAEPDRGSASPRSFPPPRRGLGHQPTRTTEYFPYGPQAIELCLSYLDGQAAQLWPLVSEDRMVSTTFGATFVWYSGPPAAPLLVMLHGAGATSLMWSPNVAALSRSPDRRG